MTIRACRPKLEQRRLVMPAVALAKAGGDDETRYRGFCINVEIKLGSHGCRRVGGGPTGDFLTRVAQVLPKAPSVFIKTTGDLLYFDTMSLTCRRIDAVPNTAGPTPKLARQAPVS